MTSSSQTHLVSVHGRVQGVGFRESCVDEARRLGVTGWVRNCADGTVQVLIQGSPQQLAAMHDWLRRGPPLARVDTVRPLDVPHGTQPLDRFERRPTA